MLKGKKKKKIGNQSRPFLFFFRTQNFFSFLKEDFSSGRNAMLERGVLDEGGTHRGAGHVDTG
jgi:hypothetical protein